MAQSWLWDSQIAVIKKKKKKPFCRTGGTTRVQKKPQPGNCLISSLKATSMSFSQKIHSGFLVLCRTVDDLEIKSDPFQEISLLSYV